MLINGSVEHKIKETALMMALDDVYCDTPYNRKEAVETFSDLYCKVKSDPKAGHLSKINDEWCIAANYEDMNDRSLIFHIDHTSDYFEERLKEVAEIASKSTQKRAKRALLEAELVIEKALSLIADAEVQKLLKQSKTLISKLDLSESK